MRLRAGQRRTTPPGANPAERPSGSTKAVERARPDGYLDPDQREALMGDAHRADQHAGPRPAPRMTAAPQVRPLRLAASSSPAPGVELTVLSRSADDPSLSLTRTVLQPGATLPAARTETDVRALVEGRGTLMLQGVGQAVVPGDVLLLPRGTRFELTAETTLTLWSAATFGDAPMRCGAGVLAEDSGREFFVGEGVLILERANSPQDPAVGFDRARVPAGVTSALHTLKVDERYLITRGSGVIELDGVQTAVAAGDVALIPQGTAQRITADRGGVDFYCVTTPRFVTEDYDQHLADARVDPAHYDGSAGPLAEVEAKLHSET
ncbi:MAG: hypothetical protein IPJ65_11970 [Archangiaceae bacterium]|nr:hypothetical protein [Archangiaceae bacterium]